MEASLANTSVIPKPPQAKCHVCGNGEVAALCHHCGRPLCADHAPDRRDWSDTRQSAEHVGLGLESTPCGDTAVHCQDCHHVVRLPSLGLLSTGAIGIVAGRFLQQELNGPGLALLIAAVMVSVLGGGLYLRRWWQLRHGRPPLPWVPKLRSVQVLETIDGALTLLSDGAYRSELLGAGGKLRVEGVLGEPERSIYQKYLVKHRISAGEDLPFQAGFLLLRGNAAVAFDEPPELPNAGLRVLSLEGRTSEEPARRAIRGEGIGEWNREWPYRIEPCADEEQDLPIQLVPFVKAEAGGQVLGLELRWGQSLPPRPLGESHDGSRWRNREPSSLGVVTIEELEVSVPFSWGEVEAVGDHLAVRPEPDGNGELCRVLTWRKVVPTSEEARRCRRGFQLQFERRIDLAAKLKGRLVLDLMGAYSGLERVDRFFCLGYRCAGSAEITTRVSAALDLHLDALRHREVRVFPDPKRADERPLVEPLTFEGVVPDHSTVIALGRALTEHGYYLKSLVENPPRSGSRPNSLSRLWDLSGRIDDHVYPMEFHLTLTGEEVSASGGRGPTGSTTTTLAVQGAYGDSVFEEKVIDNGQRLRDVVERTLGAIKRPDPSLEEPDAPSWISAKPPGASAPGLGSVAEPSLQCAGRLRDLLLDGKITQEVYLELKSELAREGAGAAGGKEEGP